MDVVCSCRKKYHKNIQCALGLFFRMLLNWSLKFYKTAANYYFSCIRPFISFHRKNLWHSVNSKLPSLSYYFTAPLLHCTRYMYMCIYLVFMYFYKKFFLFIIHSWLMDSIILCSTFTFTLWRTHRMFLHFRMFFFLHKIILYSLKMKLFIVYIKKYSWFVSLIAMKFKCRDVHIFSRSTCHYVWRHMRPRARRCY